MVEIMKILLLSPYSNIIKNNVDFDSDDVSATSEKIETSSLSAAHFQMAISFGYRHIIPQSILDMFPLGCINLHISYLPWNKGADPNLWSFLEDTPKGVTIHYMDKGVDTGDILLQEEFYFNDGETLRTTYNFLNDKIIRLFSANWNSIRSQKIISYPQNAAGTMHRAKDKEKYSFLLKEGWDTKIDVIRGRALR